jgi:hypothetical protein
LKPRFAKDNIRVSIDNVEVINTVNNKYSKGMAGSGCGFDLAEFDIFEISDF